jgi:hypothetical protein
MVQSIFGMHSWELKLDPLPSTKGVSGALILVNVTQLDLLLVRTIAKSRYGHQIKADLLPQFPLRPMFALCNLVPPIRNIWRLVQQVLFLFVCGGAIASN